MVEIASVGGLFSEGYFESTVCATSQESIVATVGYAIALGESIMKYGGCLFNLGTHLVRAAHYRDLRISAFREWSRALA